MSNGNGGLARIQWSSVIAAIGLLGAIGAFAFNAYLTLLGAVDDLHELRASGLATVARLEAEVKGNQANLAQIAQRLETTENYVMRVVEQADRRGDLLGDLIAKLDPALALQYQRQRAWEHGVRPAPLGDPAEIRRHSEIAAPGVSA